MSVCSYSFIDLLTCSFEGWWGLKSGSSSSVDEHGLVVGSRNRLESVEEEEKQSWNTSSKIVAVDSTLQALPKVNVHSCP
jgi:hypothetical protein